MSKRARSWSLTSTDESLHVNRVQGIVESIKAALTSAEEGPKKKKQQQQEEERLLLGENVREKLAAGESAQETAALESFTWHAPDRFRVFHLEKQVSCLCVEIPKSCLPKSELDDYLHKRKAFLKHVAVKVKSRFPNVELKVVELSNAHKSEGFLLKPTLLLRFVSPGVPSVNIQLIPIISGDSFPLYKISPAPTSASGSGGGNSNRIRAALLEDSLLEGFFSELSAAVASSASFLACLSLVKNWALINFEFEFGVLNYFYLYLIAAELNKKNYKDNPENMFRKVLIWLSDVAAVGAVVRLGRLIDGGGRWRRKKSGTAVRVKNQTNI